MSGKRWLLVLSLLGALLLGSVAILLLVVLPRYVESKVLSTAGAHGVTLKPNDIAFGWGWVQLTQVSVNFDRVRPIEVHVGRIDVTLDGLTPLSIVLSNVEAQVQGSISNVGLELGEWTKTHPEAYSLPLSASNVHVRFVDIAGAEPWLDVSQGELSRTATGGIFAAQHARFLGVDLGKVGAGFARDSSGIALGFGESDLARAPFRIGVSTHGPSPSATFTIEPIAAERLAKPFGVPLPASGVIVSSETRVVFATGVSAGSLSGSTSVTLKGYVPPHPFELDGFIFGDTTYFDTQFALPATRDRITLTQTHLKAGSFELHGDGLLSRSPDHSEITVNLSGELPCSALAAVEAESRLSKILGGALGAKAGKFAEKLINGSVSVGLKLSADTRRLLAARIERKIGVGCGLHPLTFAELNRLLPLPADVNELIRNLPSLPDLSKLPAVPGLAPLPTALPPLPSGLPTLFGLPPIVTAAPAVTAKPTPKPSPASKPSAPTSTSSGG